MVLWSWIVSVHHASSPNVSKRNTSRPWFSSLADVSSIAWSLPTVTLGPVLGADSAPAAAAAPAIATMSTRQVILHRSIDTDIQPPSHGYRIGRQRADPQRAACRYSSYSGHNPPESQSPRAGTDRVGAIPQARNSS